MNQTGFISRGTVTYKDGKRLTDRGWISAIDMMHGTYMDYVLNIRQKYSEDIFASRYEGLGNTVHAEWTLRECVIDEGAADGYRVTSKIKHEPTGQAKTVRRCVQKGSSTKTRLDDRFDGSISAEFKIPAASLSVQTAAAPLYVS